MNDLWLLIYVVPVLAIFARSPKVSIPPTLSDTSAPTLAVSAKEATPPVEEGETQVTLLHAPRVIFGGTFGEHFEKLRDSRHRRLAAVAADEGRVEQSGGAEVRVEDAEVGVRVELKSGQGQVAGGIRLYSILVRQQNGDDRFTGITRPDDEFQRDKHRVCRMPVTRHPVELEPQPVPSSTAGASPS